MAHRILLVDDDTDLLAVSGDVLQDAGFSVTSCTSGRAEIRSARTDLSRRLVLPAR